MRFYRYIVFVLISYRRCLDGGGRQIELALAASAAFFAFEDAIFDHILVVLVFVGIEFGFVV